MKPISRTRQGFRSEEGFSLFVAMTAIVLLTALVVTGYSLALYTSKDSTRARVKNAAFQTANSAADRVLASWGTASTTSGSGAIGSNTYVWSYGTPTVLSAYNQYTLEVTGTANQGTTAATSHVTVTFSALALWDMNIGVGAGNGTAASSGNSSFQGNSIISGPFYIKGDFEMGTSNNSSYDGGPSGQRGPLFVRGNVTEFGGGTVGNFDLFCNGDIEGLSSLSDVTLFRDVPNLQLPEIGADATWLQSAQDQSKDGRSGDTSATNAWESAAGDGSTPAVGASQPNYKVVTGDVTINSSTAAWGRYPAAIDADTQPHGDFAYDGAGNLYVEGTVYISGNLNINRAVTYRGNGVLFVKGTSVYGVPAFSTTGTFLPPGTATVQGGGHLPVMVGTASQANCVGIVSPRLSADSADPAIIIDSDVHCPVFSNGILSVQHNSTFYGACLSYGLQVGGTSGSNAGLVMDGSLFAILPASIPGKGAYIVAIQTWRRPQ